MNKRLTIYGSIFAAVLVGAIAVIYFSMSSPGEKVVKNKNIQLSDKDIYATIPIDAVAICDVKKFEIISGLLLKGDSNYSKFLNEDEPMGKFLKFYSEKIIPVSNFTILRSEQALISFHQTAKNEVSTLFIQKIPKSTIRSLILNEFKAHSSKSAEYEYGETKIVELSDYKIYVSLYKNYLLVSQSLTLIESSLRHIENNTSILDNSSFDVLLSQAKADISLFVNHSHIDKYFNEIGGQRLMKSASFFTSLSSWSLIETKILKNRVAFEIESLNTKAEENYFHIFSKLRTAESELYRMVPYNANFAFSFPMPSSKDFVAGYRSFLEANKKKVAIDKARDNWLETIELEEVGVLSLPLGYGDERLLLLKGKSVRTLLSNNAEADKYNYKGYISSYLGGLFKATSEDSIVFMSNWAVIGKGETIQAYKDNLGDGSFAIYQYLNQAAIYDDLKGAGYFSGFVNFYRFKESIGGLFKAKRGNMLTTALDDFNFEFGTIQLYSNDKRTKIKGSLIIENRNKLPQPKVSANGELPIEMTEDINVMVSKGPFSVRNFVDGTTNYLEQLPNNMIRMTDSKNNGKWTIAFDNSICGYVEQIDYFKNGKLQMLFASGSKLYLLDRLGRWVSPFPVDLGKELVLGPKIVDINNSGDYNVMVLHKDNTLEVYDLKGKPVNGWNTITTQEKIIQLPEVQKIGSNTFWVLRTKYQTLIYDIFGIPVADFSRKNVISPDSEIVVKSESNIELINLNGKKVTLNLESGKFGK